MIEEGYSRYACDRAESAHRDGTRPVEFYRPEDKAVERWIQVDYTDTNDVRMRLTLCPECAEKYASIKATQDRDMTEFANEGM